MLGKLTTSRLQVQLRVVLGVFCLLLIVLGSVVSVTHSHAHEDISHQDCGLCVTAHMAVQVAVTVSQVCVTQVFTRVETSQPVARPQVTPQSVLFSRPPPADWIRS